MMKEEKINVNGLSKNQKPGLWENGNNELSILCCAQVRFVELRMSYGELGQAFCVLFGYAEFWLR